MRDEHGAIYLSSDLTREEVDERVAFARKVAHKGRVVLLTVEHYLRLQGRPADTAGYLIEWKVRDATCRAGLFSDNEGILRYIEENNVRGAEVVPLYRRAAAPVGEPQQFNVAEFTRARNAEVQTWMRDAHAALDALAEAECIARDAATVTEAYEAIKTLRQDLDDARWSEPQREGGEDA